MEWIKISDQLPPENQAVLVTDGEDMYIYTLKYNCCDAQYCFDYDQHYTNEEFDTLTHWMPLPQLPTI